MYDKWLTKLVSHLAVVLRTPLFNVRERNMVSKNAVIAVMYMYVIGLTYKYV